MLQISRGSLEAYLAGVGFDRSRPCSIAATGPDDVQRQTVEKLKALAASAPLPWAAPPGATAAGLADALAPFASSHAASWRALLPATDATKLHASIGDVLKKRHWTLRGGAYVRPASELSDFALPMLVTLTDGAAIVAIDIDVGATPRPEDAVESLHKAMREAHDPPPSLDGDVLRVEWAPSALATMGALQTAMPGAAHLSSEAERDGLPGSRRDQYALALLTEAVGVPKLASGDKGPYFDRIELTLRFSPFELSVRAHPGGGFTMPTATAWRPSRSVALDDPIGSVDVATALVAGWTFPVEEQGHLLWLTRETTPMGWLVALPHLLVDAPLVQADELIMTRASLLGPKGAPAGTPWATWIKHFERVGVDLEGGEPTFIGVLPAGTQRANAECALAPKMPCDAKARLTFGAATKGTPIVSTIIRCGFPDEPFCRYVPQDWPFFARLVSVGGRFVVLAARPDSPLAKPKAQDLGPFHFSLLLSHLQPHLSGSLPERVVGDVHEDGGTIVFHFAAPEARVGR